MAPTKKLSRNDENHLNLVNFISPKTLIHYFSHGQSSGIYQVNPVIKHKPKLAPHKSTEKSISDNCSVTIDDNIDTLNASNNSSQSSTLKSSTNTNDSIVSNDIDDNDDDSCDSNINLNYNHVKRIDIVTQEICCLLAEGSPTCFISNFSSMIEFYEKIAKCFDISAKDIMYCTLNTPKIDMDNVLCGQICPNDIVFVHRKGRHKDVEIRKYEPFLGITIADNGYGCCYIRKIRPNSTASKIPFLQIGNQIESIMGESMLDKRHFEVAAYLKSIPLNEIFTIGLIEPIATSDNDVQLHSNNDHNKSPVINRLKFSHNKSSNQCYDEIDLNHQNDYDDYDRILFYTALFYINKQLEKFIGINDDELAEELWFKAIKFIYNPSNNDKKQSKMDKFNTDVDNNAVYKSNLTIKTPSEYIETIRKSDLNEFKFTENFLFDIWTIIQDILDGHLKLPNI